MQAIEGEGRSETEFTEIETIGDSFDGSVIFHVVNDIIGFVLYMHQQTPSPLQDITHEFDALRLEYEELEKMLAQTELKASLRRNYAGRKREIKRVIKRLDKLMKSVSNLRNSLQLIITEVPNIEGVIVALGSSPLRPQHIYELCFSHGTIVHGGTSDYNRSKFADVLSRKAIRTLISKGAGSVSYTCPSKLFVLVKARSSFNLPMHFLPKREIKHNKKIAPFRLRFKCKTKQQEIDLPYSDPRTIGIIDTMDSTSNELIWFQSKHVIKGLPSKASPADE